MKKKKKKRRHGKGTYFRSVRIGFLSKGDNHFFPSKEKGKDELQRKQHVQKARGSTAHLWRKQKRAGERSHRKCG